MVVSLLLLLAIWSLLLQLLSLVLGPPVLEPHLHLDRRRNGFIDDDEDVKQTVMTSGGQSCLTRFNMNHMSDRGE